MSVGTLCRTARRHTGGVATFSNIPTAHNLMCLYTGRDCSVGTGINCGLHGPEIESRFGGDFLNSSTLDLEPNQTSGKWEPSLFPKGKLSGTWRCPPTTCSFGVKERVEIYSCSTSGTSWPVLSGALC